MKNSISILLLLGFFVTLILNGCNTVSSDDTESQIDKIASDELYYKFRRIDFEHKKAIANGEFAIDEIHKILYTQSGMSSACEWDKSLFTRVRGGIKYVETFCERSTIQSQLDKKYPVLRKRFKAVYDRFEQLHPEFALENEEFLKSKIDQITNTPRD